jgi:Fe-S-cluster-containing hydrogenase components 1
MARLKFLCDADRCIECNACVTACKNENEVPWGINPPARCHHQRRQAG